MPQFPILIYGEFEAAVGIRTLEKQAVSGPFSYIYIYSIISIYIYRDIRENSWLSPSPCLTQN